jgi:hypothetical protein
VDLDLVLPGDIDDVRGPARRLAARLDAGAHILGRDEKRVWRIETGHLKVELWPLGGLDLDQDIRRRDYTCNALMWQLPNGPLVDRVGGSADIEAGVLRAITKKNLESDPVRLVRAARFLAQFEDFELDPKTSGWIESLAPRVRRCPRERIGQELFKMFAAGDLERGFRSLHDLGLMRRLVRPSTRFDEAWFAANLAAVTRMRPGAHPLRVAIGESGPAAPLAFFLRAWSSPAPDSVAAYAWPRRLRLGAARSARLLDEMIQTVGSSAADRRSLIYRAGSSFPVALAFAAAVEPGHAWARWWRLWRRRGDDLVAFEPLLSGTEVAAILGMSPSPALGRAIDALTNAQVRGEIRTPGGATRWLRKNVGTIDRLPFERSIGSDNAKAGNSRGARR